MQNNNGLELCMSGGGVWGGSAAGFVAGLYDGGMVPKNICGISSGNHAAYMGLSENSPEKIAWIFSEMGNSFGRSFKKSLRTALKIDKLNKKNLSYDDWQEIEDVWGPIVNYFLGKKHLIESGVKSFYVGYTDGNGFKFSYKDAMEDSISEKDVVRLVIQSGMIPFLTMPKFSYNTAFDGGFSRGLFSSGEEGVFRLGVVYQGGKWSGLSGRGESAMDGIAYIKSPSATPLYAKEDKILECFWLSYQDGLMWAKKLKKIGIRSEKSEGHYLEENKERRRLFLVR